MLYRSFMMIFAVFLFALVVIANTDGFLANKGFYPWTSGYPVYTTTKRSYSTKYDSSATTNKYPKYTTRNPFLTKGKSKRSLDWSAQHWAVDSFDDGRMGEGGKYPTKASRIATYYRPWMGGGSYPTHNTVKPETTTKYRPWMGGGSYPTFTTVTSKTTTKYRPWMGGESYPTFTTVKPKTTRKYRPWMGGGSYPTFTTIPHKTTRKYRPWMD